MSSWQNASTCYSALSSGGMNDKNYFAAGPAPSAFVSKIVFAGTSAFINLKTGVLMGMDSQGNYLTTSQMISWATQANQ